MTPLHLAPLHQEGAPYVVGAKVPIHRLPALLAPSQARALVHDRPVPLLEWREHAPPPPPLSQPAWKYRPHHWLKLRSSDAILTVNGLAYKQCCKQTPPSLPHTRPILR
ncbi:hypothetical protein CGRA01v4_12149 [Colletotrichum graminicola]|nr:hypothetical protein CGRA01v4_12149 [Colletotrichum graminicola]